MKPNIYEHDTSDRMLTRDELSEVVGLMADLRQLPFEAVLDFVAEWDRPSDRNEPGLWIDPEGEDGTSGGIDALARSIVGRRDRLN
jgi:hypothetical protein